VDVGLGCTLTVWYVVADIWFAKTDHEAGTFVHLIDIPLVLVLVHHAFDTSMSYARCVSYLDKTDREERIPGNWY
jgi:hypothetical protein